MSDDDRTRWDARYLAAAPSVPADVAVPACFADHANEFPRAGHALELACGSGGASVWLAQRGLDVLGVDVSPVAVARGQALAAATGVADRCRFAAWDLDGGLPPGPPADVVLCHRFRDPRLDRALVARLATGGLLAISVLSEVGAAPGRFRARPGELLVAFADLTVLDTGEGDGEAWLLAHP